MKKILVNLIVFALILGITTSTYAFSVSVDSNVSEVRTNNEVTLEVNFEQNVVTTDFVVRYDTSKFKFVKANTAGTEVNNIEASGELVVCFYDMDKVGTSKIELVFKSRENEGVGKFELSDITGHTKTVEVSKVGSTSIKNVSINNGEDNVESSNTITSTPGSRDDIDTTVSNSRLPDTGAKVSILLGVIILSVGILVIKYKKNISQIINKSKGIFSIIILAGILVVTNNTLALSLLNVKVDESNKLITVESFVGSILEKDSLEDALEEEITSDKIATGLNVKENYSLIIYGDINKDGKINSSDIYEIIYSDVKELDDVQKIAANVFKNEENEINENDVKVIEKYILRLDNLVLKNSDTTEDTEGELEETPETPETDDINPEVPGDNTEETPGAEGNEPEVPGDNTEETPGAEGNEPEVPGDNTEETPGTEGDEPEVPGDNTEETPGTEGDEPEVPGDNTEEMPGTEGNEPEVPGDNTEETPGTEENNPEVPEEPRDPICRKIIKEIKYSNTNITWEDVTVVVTATEELGETEGWTLSEDKMSVSKTYTMNTVEKVKIYAANGDYEEIKVTILNIWELGQEDDIEDLTASISARNQDGKYGKTYGSVIVTITTNNPITCPDGWTKVGYEGTKIQKEFTENAEELVKLTDMYGSKLNIKVKVDNILIAIEELEISAPYEKDTNGVYLINTSDESLIENLGFLVTTVINPTNASNQKLEWTITDENGNAINYATISEGRVRFASKTVTEVYGETVITREVLADSVAIGNKFVITAKTTDVSNIEKTITCSIEAAPTKIDMGLNNIYLFINGDATKLLGTEDYLVIDDNGNIVETITNEIYQTEEKTLTATVYPATSTINNEVNYRLVRDTGNNGFAVEESSEYAVINGNVITGLKNTGDVDNLYVEAYTGKDGSVVSRAKLKVYTTPESVAIVNTNDEELTSLNMSTNKTNSITVRAKLMPDTVSTEFDSSKIEWYIDNASVIELPESVNGKDITLKAVGEGTANLTLTASNGKTVTLPISVGVDIESIKIDPATTTLENGVQKESKKLSVIFTPEDYTGDREIEWTTSNENQVTVDQSGIVTAVENTGNTPVTITATLKSNPTITATAKVSVANIPTQLTLSPTTATVYVNSTSNKATITATIDADATTSVSQPIYWESSDESIATVASKQSNVAVGATTTTMDVTGLRNGTAKITAYTAGTTSTRKVAEATITVQTDPTSVVPKVGTVNLKKTGEIDIDAIVLPLNANHNTELTYKSSDTAVATVNASGTITAVENGNATITVTTANGKTSTVTVNVSDVGENELKYRVTKLTLKAGASRDVNVRKGTGLTETITYSSSNTDIATVDSNGKITAVKAGNATITAKCGTATTTCSVTVLDYSATATVNGSANVTLKHNTDTNNTRQLSVITANSASVKWYSSKPSVASVDSKGLVTSKSGGSCTIYAIAPGAEDATAVWNVTVQVSPASIKLESYDGSNDVYAGGTKKIKVTYADGTTVDKGITWTPLAGGIVNGDIVASDETDVYEVNIVEEITVETNISIKATTANGKTATITLKVLPAVSTSSLMLFSSRVATTDLVSAMFNRANNEKEVKYVEIENSKLFDKTTNNNYYAIVNENNETKLIKIVNGQRLENSITINTSNILDIEALDETIVNILVRENENTLEVLKIDFANVEILSRYKIYTENEENVENTLVKLNEKENQLAVLKVYEDGNVEVNLYDLSNVKNANLNEIDSTTLNIAKGTEEGNFNRYTIKAFTVLNNSIYLIEENEEAYLTIFNTNGNIELLNKVLDKTNIENVVATNSEIYVGI